MPPAGVSSASVCLLCGSAKRPSSTLSRNLAASVGESEEPEEDEDDEGDEDLEDGSDPGDFQSDA